MCVHLFYIKLILNENYKVEKVKYKVKNKLKTRAYKVLQAIF